MNAPSQPRADLASHLLVTCQFAGLALACLPLAPQRSPAWLVLCAAGALLGFAALWFNRPGNFSVYPQPKAGTRLITAGPYRYVRHPMYSALLLMVAGIAFFNGHWLNYVGALAVLVAVGGKARKEEDYLLARFAGYREYAARTGRFVPFVRG